MILRFFSQSPVWEADPDVPDRLLIQASMVGGYHVNFECVSEIHGKPDGRLWSVKLFLNDNKPDDTYLISVGHPSRKVVLHAPQEGVRARSRWCCVVEGQACLILPDFKPSV